MTPTEYQKLAERTSATATNQGCEDVVNRMGDREVRLLHGAMGLCTEVGELFENLIAQVISGGPPDLTNIVEELGDGYWYAAEIYNALDLEMPTPVITPRGDITVFDNVYDLFRLATIAGSVQDALKRTLFYGAPLNVDLIENMTAEFILLSAKILLGEGISVESVMEKNIAKLQARFPDKFDSDKALNRDLAAERAELEKEVSTHTPIDPLGIDSE